MIKLANLVEKKEGSIHYIYTKGEIQDEAEAVKKEKILTKVYKLNYVRSDEMMIMIRPFLSADVGLKRFANTPSYRYGISESVTFVRRRRRRRLAVALAAVARRGGGAGGGAGWRRVDHHGHSSGDRRQLTLRQRPAHHPGL